MTKKEEALINFKKASSLLNKIIQMTENNEYCINIMQQNLAAIGLLKAGHIKLMENHLHSCFADAMETTNKKKKLDMIEEILTVTKYNNK